MHKYRVLVQYDSEGALYVARAPELEPCSGEGATRAEAIAKVEEEIAAQLQNAREQGGSLPPAIDDDGSPYSGVVTLHLSRSLHREMVWQARVEGIDLDQLLSEMLPLALQGRRQAGRHMVRNASLAASHHGPSEGGNGPARGQSRDERGGRRGYGSSDRYHAIMDDRATFLEYVRGLDSSGSAMPNQRRRGRGHGRGFGNRAQPGNEGGARGGGSGGGGGSGSGGGGGGGSGDPSNEE
ncbi:MAG: type II toxin-antitoxin system HicB family antitoxin [Pseudomonadota bacterium]